MIEIFGLHFKGAGSKFWSSLIDILVDHMFISTIIGLPFVLLVFILSIITPLFTNFGLSNLASGFTIFSFFPFWLRVFIDAYITSLILCIPVTIIAGAIFYHQYLSKQGQEVEVEGKYVLMNLTDGYVGKFIELPNEFEGKIGAKYRVRYK